MYHASGYLFITERPRIFSTDTPNVISLTRLLKIKHEMQSVKAWPFVMGLLWNVHENQNVSFLLQYPIKVS